MRRREVFGLRTAGDGERAGDGLREVPAGKGSEKADWDG